MNVRRTSVGLLAVLPLVLTACGEDESQPAGQPSASASASSPSAAGDDVAETVKIRGGASLYVECAGSGSPTVVFEAGDESGHEDWSAVFPAVAERTRACAYDRLGTGASDLAPEKSCRQLGDFRRDLEGVLRAVGERGPYVLVGASGGGYLAAGFAYAHPKDVHGVVLIETHAAINLSEHDAELAEILDCRNDLNVERRDYVAVENDAWSDRHELGDLPVTVITNRFSKQEAESKDDRLNVERQKGWLVLSPQAKQVVVTSGHDVPINEPDLVIKEILRVVTAARAG